VSLTHQGLRRDLAADRLEFGTPRLLPLRPTALPSGDGPAGVVASDFDGDGHLDLATANNLGDDVSVYRGDGTGGFLPAGATAPTVGDGPVALVTGDFDRDSILDLAVANHDSGDVSVLRGDGNGGFHPATAFAVGAEPFSLTAGDFDDDGHLDLATAHLGGAVVVLLGDGAGGFAPASGSPLTVSLNPFAIVAADVNADGDLDLVTGSIFKTSDVTVLLGDGAGGFAPAPGSPFVAGVAPASLTVADFNADGHADLATGDLAAAAVNLFLGDSTGAFGPAGTFAVGADPRALAVADFNGDGHLDLAAANSGEFTPGAGDDVSLLLGAGAGGFDPALYFAVGDQPVALVADDFNEDGSPDLATANFAGDDVTVLLIDPPPAQIEEGLRSIPLEILSDIGSDRLVTATVRVPTGLLDPGVAADVTLTIALVELTVSGEENLLLTRTYSLAELQVHELDGGDGYGTVVIQLDPPTEELQGNSRVEVCTTLRRGTATGPIVCEILEPIE
jgi:hypothetical protein